VWDRVTEKVASRLPSRRAGRSWDDAASASLYAQDGDRKYLNAEERRRVLAALDALPPERALFVLTLAWTGARVSEVLALTLTSFQLEASTVTIRTLTRRRFSVREVPIPPDLIAALNRQFGIRNAQRNPGVSELRLWSFCRQTAWRLVRELAHGSGIRGRRAALRGFRHGFGIATLTAGVPLNLVQRWMGHSSLAVTSIYAAASGPEEAAFAARFWNSEDAPLRVEGMHATPLR
jgi:integrase/recombinase XerD